MKRLLACWSIVLSATVLGATPAWSAEASTQRLTARSMADPAGDVVDSDGAKLNDARGDILQAAADYTAGVVLFEVRVAKFTDPVKDPNWNSDSTYLLWRLDTNGDEEADYTIEYGTEDGKVYGAVFEVGATDNAPAVCTSPSLPGGPTGTYALRLDPSCIGRPDSFAWLVEASYDTNARDDDAPATEDLVPDVGFSPPLYAPAGAPAGANGTTKTVPGNGASSSPAAGANGQSSGTAGANGDAATAVSSAAAGATAGGPSADPGQTTKAGSGAANASASATAASPSSNQAAEGSTEASGTNSEHGAKVKKASGTATDNTGATEDGSGSTLLIVIIVAAAVMLLAVAGILVRTLRSRDPVSADV